MPPKEHTSTGLHISGTRVRAHEDCQRLYWWQYGPPKMTAPSKPWHLRGTALHWVAENWLRDGIPPSKCPPPADPKVAEHHEQVKIMFQAGVHLWPTPGLVQVELPGSMELPNGETFTGTLDVWDPNAETSKVAGLGSGLGLNIPIVGDHKSTKAKHYIKTAAQLKKDPQVLGYGRKALELSGKDLIAFQWVYYLTEGKPEAFPVRFIMSRADIEKGWEKIVFASEQIVDNAKHTDYRSVPFNEKFCDQFGGCYFRSRCFGSKQQEDTLSNPGASLFKKLDPNGAAVATSATMGVNPPAQTAAKPTGGLFGKPAASATDTGKNAAMNVVQTVTNEQKTEVFSEIKPATEPASEAIAVPGAGDVPPPKKRGRPVKAVVASEEQAKAHTLMVLVDCLAQSGLGEAVPLVKVAGPAMQAAAQAFGKANWRLIEYTAAGSLAEYFDRQIAETPLSGVVFVDSDTQEGRALLPVLEAVADVVIRGC